MNDNNVESRAVPRQCPSREVLSDLALGKIPLDAIEAIGRHVESCPACQATLESLDGLEDSVIADLKGCSSPLPPDPQLQEQIREAEQISRVVWGQSKPELPDEPPPARLGQYEILGKIGRGGMGTVYKALHTRLKRPVALKLLPTARLKDPEAVARFQDEMEAVGRLDHPNLVRAHDAGEVEGQHFLVMEFLEGIDLGRLVRTCGPLATADASEAVRQAALGLQYAHEHGLVHRDVKPSNLMLTNGGQVKVLDLGLARLTLDAAQKDEKASRPEIVGTGDFIAPEQGKDAQRADARSDVYALGCTMYFLLTGRAPFARPQYDSFAKKVMAHEQEPVLPVEHLRADVPSDLASILSKMVAKQPGDRYMTAAEVARALQPWTGDADLQALVNDACKLAVKRQDRRHPEPPAPGATDQRLPAKGRFPGRNFLVMWLVLPIGVVVAMAAAIAWIDANQGELVIHSPAPTVEVNVEKETPNGTDVWCFRGEREYRSRFYPGPYTIEIAETPEQFEVSPYWVEIRRGQSCEVTITPKAATTANVKHPQPDPGEVTGYAKSFAPGH